MKDYDKNEASPYLKYLDVNILYGRAMSQLLPINEFNSVEEFLNLMKIS